MIKQLEQFFENFKISQMTLFLSSQQQVRNLLSTAVSPTIDGLIANSLGESPLIYKYSDFNKMFPIAPVRDNSFLNNYAKQQACSLIISSYEWLKEDLKIKGKWNNLKDLPKEIRLFKCLRDAAAHNNKFFLKDASILPIAWRTKSLHAGLDETPLFNDWITYGDIYYFFIDVSSALANI